jgi:hypothetical protein
MALYVLILVLLSTQQRQMDFDGCNSGTLQLYIITDGNGQYEPMTFKCLNSFEFTPSHSEESGSTPLCLMDDRVIASGFSSFSCCPTDRAKFFYTSCIVDSVLPRMSKP